MTASSEPAEQRRSPRGTGPPEDRNGEGETADGVRETVTLSDGRTVVVRSVTADDADALASGYQQLSTTSAFQRFFTATPRLSDQQVRYFTAVDHRDHEAVGAVSTRSGNGVGVARYIRDDPDDPRRAEVAIVVIDDWQRLGLGRELLRVLCRRAREEDITTLRAEFLSENRALPALLRCFGDVHITSSGATSTATLTIAPTEK